MEETVQVILKNKRRIYNQKYQREYRKLHKEYLNKLSRECIRNRRKEVLKILGGKCVKCGKDDWRCLQIDHVHGGGRKEIILLYRGISYYNKVIKEVKSGSKDYQLLCANCNWIKRYEERECWIV